MATKTRLEVGQLSDPGRKREHNEDCVYVFRPEDPDQSAKRGDLYIVADGMGGHIAGAAASDRATRRASEEYYFGDTSASISDSLTRAIKLANSAIREYAQSDPKFAAMGTTFVGAVIHGDTVTVANVGDSRAYLVRRGVVRKLTEDHSWVEEQVRAGRMTPEQARIDQRRNMITRSLGTRPDVDVDIFTEQLDKDDTIVLCSDGLHGQVGDAEIGAVAGQLSPQPAAVELVSRANARGGPDNISVVIVGPHRRDRLPGAPGSGPPPLAIAAGAAAALVVLLIAVALATRQSQNTSLPAQAPAGAVSTKTSGNASPPIVTGSSPSGGANPLPSPSTVAVNAVTISSSSTNGSGAGPAASAQPTSTLASFNATGPAVAPTDTLAPTSTDSGPSPTPRPAATPVPASAPAVADNPTPTPAAASVGVITLNPPQVGSGQVVLSWSYSTPLTPDEVFDVRVCQCGQPTAGIANVTDTSYAFGGNKAGGQWTWTVAVIKKQGSQVLGTIAVADGTSTFNWTPSSNKGNSTQR